MQKWSAFIINQWISLLNYDEGVMVGREDGIEIGKNKA